MKGQGNTPCGEGAGRLLRTGRSLVHPSSVLTESLVQGAEREGEKEREREKEGGRELSPIWFVVG